MKTLARLRPILLLCSCLVMGHSAGADQPSDILQVGQLFALTPQDDSAPDGIQATILSVKIAKHVGGDFMGQDAAEGGEYIAVVWKYKNTSHQPINAFDAPNLELVDSKGGSYNPDIDASASYGAEVNTTTKIFSDINPGITVKDAEVFEISKSDFDANTWYIHVKNYEDFVSLHSLVSKKRAAKH